MHSYLIVGGDVKQRLEKAYNLVSSIQYPVSSIKKHPDILILNPDPSIGIKAIRNLNHFLSLKPFKLDFKTIIIPKSEKLTIPAQNAFLKTLEEPPANSLIFLGCQNKDQLLPTIVSRCQVVKLATDKSININKTILTNHLSLITNILNSGVGERLKLIEPYSKNREQAVKFLKTMIKVLREKMISSNQQLVPTKSRIPPVLPRVLEEIGIGKAGTINNQQLSISNQQFAILISSFQQTLNLINANINVKLAMDNLVINLPY